MAEPRRTQDVNVAMIATVGVIGTLLLVVAVVGIQAWIRVEMQREVEAKVYTAPQRELEQLRQQQLAELQGGRQVETDEGVRATLSIERAMEEVARQY
ncbi:MAG: hypothetical protein ACOCTI_03095 [Phycisphaeraceae bacterium]